MDNRQINIDIDKLKGFAAKQTLNHFQEYYDYTPDYGKLIYHLLNENKYLKIELDWIDSYLKIGDTKKINKRFKKYLKDSTDVIIMIKSDENGYSTNTFNSNKSELANELCLFTFHNQFYIEVINQINVENNSNLIHKLKKDSEYYPQKTKINNQLLKLNEYGFSQLDKLNGIDLNELAYHIFINPLPYQIAYLEYLGFVDHLKNSYSKSQTELYQLLSDILDINKRAISGNINGLRNTKSKDRGRYTAYQHQEKVDKHYQTLK